MRLMVFNGTLVGAFRHDSVRWNVHLLRVPDVMLPLDFNSLLVTRDSIKIFPI